MASGWDGDLDGDGMGASRRRDGIVIGFASANDDYPLLPGTYKNQKRFNAFLDSRTLYALPTGTLREICVVKLYHFRKMQGILSVNLTLII